MITLRLHLPRASYQLQLEVELAGRGITVLFGPSGSGKTSVLRCVAGLERAEDALVRIGDHVWQDERAGIFLPTWQRPLGYVFQEASLFEHLDVRRNLDYGLRRSGKGTDRAARKRALDEAIELLGISALLDRRPANLSGGERQRVAIARALALRPQLLLLDEPLAAIDVARRAEILPWLERLHAELALPMLYVTHSVDELSRLADEVVVLDQGQAQAHGPLAEVMTQGALPALIGDEAAAVIEASVSAQLSEWQLLRVSLGSASMLVAPRDEVATHPVGSRLRLRIAARDVSLSLQAPTASSIQNQLTVRIVDIQPDAHPAHCLLRLQHGEHFLLARLTRKAVAELALAPGMVVWAQVKAVAVLA
ncbi:MAG: molybdenum ABC transporter ATP-binding protein [Thauera sp.]|jgi:molybdate transport system ATP-binding protein|nr:molybdenum ABC transporter ATP-binding protein [Thauera sp.]